MGLYLHKNGTAIPVGGGMSSTLFDRVSALESGIEELKNGKADSENYGLARISESAAVTQKDLGLVLGAFEKNASVSGSIMNFAENIRKNTDSLSNSSFIFRGPVTNFNTVSKNGFYEYGGGNGIGAPQTNAWGLLLNFIGGNYKGQIFLSFNSAFKYIYFRQASSLASDYSAWRSITLN